MNSKGSTLLSIQSDKIRETTGRLKAAAFLNGSLIAACAGFDSPGPVSPIYIKLPECYSKHTGGTDPNKRGADTSHQTPMTVTTTGLVSLASIAAEAFNDFEEAKRQLDSAFGIPFNAAKDNLTRDVILAESEGLDLSVFSGENSRFKFPAHETNIVIRVHRKPTPHAKLEALATKVEKIENELKLAKLRLKHEAEQLVAAGKCDEVTEKIVLAFTRIK